MKIKIIYTYEYTVCYNMIAFDCKYLTITKMRIAFTCNCLQLLPLYVMDRMFYPGFPGLFTACIFSGALRYAWIM